LWVGIRGALLRRRRAAARGQPPYPHGRVLESGTSAVFPFDGASLSTQAGSPQRAKHAGDAEQRRAARQAHRLRHRQSPGCPAGKIVELPGTSAFKLTPLRSDYRGERLTILVTSEPLAGVTVPANAERLDPSLVAQWGDAMGCGRRASRPVRAGLAGDDLRAPHDREVITVRRRAAAARAPSGRGPRSSSLRVPVASRSRPAPARGASRAGTASGGSQPDPRLRTASRLPGGCSHSSG
jgi:hypothetical protein